MKKYLAVIGVIYLFGCGGANDGDARTDTTTMPADRGVMDTPTNNINTSTGTYPNNTTVDTNKPGTQATSPTSPQSRSTTPGKQKQ
ncbi:MAG: hypothetical protein ICV79_07575 [Flavisolibacter sp.]|nr:hypothetical protein [Flavisolibacter sp.]